MQSQVYSYVGSLVQPEEDLRFHGEACLQIFYTHMHTLVQPRLSCLTTFPPLSLELRKVTRSLSILINVFNGCKVRCTPMLAVCMVSE